MSNEKLAYFTEEWVKSQWAVVPQSGTSAGNGGCGCCGFRFGNYDMPIGACAWTGDDAIVVQDESPTPRYKVSSHSLALSPARYLNFKLTHVVSLGAKKGVAFPEVEAKYKDGYPIGYEVRKGYPVGAKGTGLEWLYAGNIQSGLSYMWNSGKYLRGYEQIVFLKGRDPGYDACTEKVVNISKEMFAGKKLVFILSEHGGQPKIMEPFFEQCGWKCLFKSDAFNNRNHDLTKDYLHLYLLQA